MSRQRANPDQGDLAAEVAELRTQLAEARETLEAIRTGAVDALVVSGPAGDHVFSLEGAETPYRFLVEEISEGALLLHPDGTILYANARFAELVNAPLEQIIGLPRNGFFPPADHPGLEQSLHAARRQALRQEFSLHSQAGAPRPVQLSLSLLKGAPAETLAAIVTDLTERKQAEKVLRLTNQKLEARIEELHQVSYAMAHDMRAPLRALQGFAELIGSQGDNCTKRQIRDYQRRIIVAAQRLDNLITDALNYTKILHQELVLQPVDLGGLITDLVQTYPNLQPDKADIHLRGPLPVVLGSESFLSQCFSNLLGNAVKFVSPGTRPQVQIWSEGCSPPTAIGPEARLHSFVRVWVEDNGIGIPGNAGQRVFGMFQKLNSDYEGTGIGLAVVKKVVERMGGRVGVESSNRGGSRFWVELLLASPPSSELPAQGCPQVLLETTSATAPVPILLAEDEESDVYLLRYALTEAGLPNPLMVVPDGVAATQYLSGEEPYHDRLCHPLPGLMLLDLKMPRMDGFAVLAWLREHTKLEHLPVIILTSSVDDADREKAIQLGASDYRIKPAKLKDLVKLLQDLHVRWLSNQPHPPPVAARAQG